jgi:pimeloyl-ACP methyl ester carboxylesterase
VIGPPGDGACSRRPSRPPSAQTVFYCLAGGRCSTSYFDFHVEGHPGYSMAEYLAGRGCVVISLDHPGIGSSSPVDDVFALTPSLVAAAHDLAVRDIAVRLEEGLLAPDLGPVAVSKLVGLGHSMGGMITVVQQARHSSFDALAVLGHGGDGLPTLLTERERAVVDGPFETLEDRIADLARERALPESARAESADPQSAHPESARPENASRPRRLRPGSFFASDVPRSVRDAFVAQQTELLQTCGLTSMISGATDRYKAAIDVPVFLAFGDQDLTSDYRSGLSRYSSVRDATLVTVAPSGHCHNQSSSRTRLWDRLERWAGALSLSHH